jgi:Spy/CpxP family protein refolding chaperone
MKLALALLLVPALALAQPPGPPPLERLAELKLTDTQRAKIEALHDAERRKTIRLDADVRIAEMDLQDAIDAGGDVAPLVARVADLRGQMLAARVATRVAVRAILTPEQRTKLKSLRPRHPMDGPPGPPR